MEIKIDKDIPLPSSVKLGKLRIDIPLGAMEIGDSIFVPFTVASALTIRNTILTYRKRRAKGSRFVTRTQNNLPAGEGLRVWRTE